MSATAEVDEHAWMRDPLDERTRAALAAEAARCAAHGARLATRQAELQAEFAARAAELPRPRWVRAGDYWYATRHAAGTKYPAVHRTRTRPVEGRGEASDTECILDWNRVAARVSGESPDGPTYFAHGVCRVSPDGAHVAYSYDAVGDERYTLEVLAIADGTSTVVARDTLAAEWADDSAALVYSAINRLGRPHEVWRWRATGAEPDRPAERIYHEVDERFEVTLRRTRSGRFIVIEAWSYACNESHLLECGEPARAPRLVREREAGHVYHVDHHDERLLIRTARPGRDWTLQTVRLDALEERWTDLLDRDPATIFAVEPFADALVVFERQDGFPRVMVFDACGGRPREVPMPVREAAFVCRLEDSIVDYPFDSSTLHLVYSSLATPPVCFGYGLEDGCLTLDAPPAEPTDLVVTRLWAGSDPAVPVTIAYRGALDGPRPLLMQAYGAYGLEILPEYSPRLLSMLDRGFIYALVHVRGGPELGYGWCLDGKILNKRNSFDDFLRAVEALADTDFVLRDQIIARGASAGGLLVAVAANERPDLFRCVFADVPFVDCVNTLRDASIPLTTQDRCEFGDPGDAEALAYLRTYSPYENVRAQPYPTMLVAAGVSDSRVGLWEPLKWVARLRAAKTDDNPLVLRVSQGGHYGDPAVDEQDEFESFVYAFMLDCLESDDCRNARSGTASRGPSGERLDAPTRGALVRR